jgi:thiol-disulfide isomerase/thioredoxin
MRIALVAILFCTFQYPHESFSREILQKSDSAEAKTIEILRRADQAVKNPSGLSFEFESFNTGPANPRKPRREGTGVLLPLVPAGGFLQRYDFDKTAVDSSGNLATQHMILAFDGEVSYLQNDRKKEILFSPAHRLGGLLLKFNLDSYLNQPADDEPFSQLKTGNMAWEGRKTAGEEECDAVRIVSDDGKEVLPAYFSASDHLPRRIEDKTTSESGVEATHITLWKHFKSVFSHSSKQFTLTPAAGYSRKEYVFGPAVGDPAPDWSVTDFHGTNQSLNSLKGSVLIMDFWATWCGPCRASIPSLQKLYDRYRKDALKIVGFTWSDSGDPLKFAKETGVSYPFAKGDGPADAYGINTTGIPAMFVIGRDGRVPDFFVGYSGPKTDKLLSKVVASAIKGHK